MKGKSMKHKNSQYLVMEAPDRLGVGEPPIKIIAHTDKDSDFTTVDVDNNSLFLTYDRSDGEVVFERDTLAIKMQLWELHELYLAVTALIKHQPEIGMTGTWYKREEES